MNRARLAVAIVLVSASCLLLPLSSSLAQRGAKGAPKPPPDPKPPAAVYESGELRLGETLREVCLAPSAAHEPYDGMDHFLIVQTADGGEALLFLGGACTFNALMFADSIAAKGDGSCAKTGDMLVISSAYGTSVECKLLRANAWHSDRANTLKTIFDDEDE